MIKEERPQGITKEQALEICKIGKHIALDYIDNDHYYEEELKIFNELEQYITQQSTPKEVEEALYVVKRAREFIVEHEMRRDKQLANNTLPLVSTKILKILNKLFTGNPNIEKIFIQTKAPTEEDVCRTLSEYYKTQYVRYKNVEVVYNEDEFASNVFSLKLNGRIRNPLAFIDSLGVININAFLPPKEFALLGQFYEGVMN